MIAFAIRRTLLAGFTTLVISIIAFMVIQLPPGDFATVYVQQLLGFGQGAGATGGILGDPAIEQQIREAYGLDRPVIIQYLKWLWRVVQLDFGVGLEAGQKITEIIGDRLFNTVVLALGTILFTWTLSIPIGIYSAVKHNTPADYTVTFVGFLGLAVPDFLLGLALLWIGLRLLRRKRWGTLFDGVHKCAVELRQVHRPAEAPLGARAGTGDCRYGGPH